MTAGSATRTGLSASGSKALETLSPADARAVLVGAQESANVPLRPADVSEKTITADGKNIRLTIVRPAGAKGTLPAFMFFHGGGWILGDFPTHERLMRDLVSESGAAAVVALMSKDRGTSSLRAQVLLWPVTDANFENASHDQFAQGHFLTKNMMKWFWDAYTTDPKQRQEIYASPLLARPEQRHDP